ncbi:hypothetical protein [Aliivibrio fischeri]|uniref:hypothetical protein n=1 Tax=Aliivibrio fischeri TaxID=668 RepID=UPI00080E1319|nr:hypothetical protein [Aliivibrio fischeri]OCH03238.1 hypothetical protein A6E11_18910 [Aliivibrio fischeri]
MFESIPINFGVIRYFLDMFMQKPEHNTLVVGKRIDNNELFAVALVDDAKISGFYLYPNCRLFFWRRWSMRKECIYVFDVKTDSTIDPNDIFSDAYPLTKKEERIFKKYNYKVIVKTRLRNYTISDSFKLSGA